MKFGAFFLNHKIDLPQQSAPKKQKSTESPLPTTSATPGQTEVGTEGSQIPTEIKPVVKHVLSKEMQLYFEKITAAILGKEDDIVEAALNSLRSDPSLHQLLPYFVQFISDKVIITIKLTFLTRL